MQWPNYFPSGCPYEDSFLAAGAVYRLINKKAPEERDFLSYRLLYPDKVFNVPECIACGLSIYTDVEDIERLKRRVPATRNKRVTVGILHESLGKMKPTGHDEASHHTWWVPLGSQPWLLFSVI